MMIGFHLFLPFPFYYPLSLKDFCSDCCQIVFIFQYEIILRIVWDLIIPKTSMSNFPIWRVFFYLFLCFFAGFLLFFENSTSFLCRYLYPLRFCWSFAFFFRTWCPELGLNVSCVFTALEESIRDFKGRF